MTEIQQTNIAVANFIIDELHKDKPFNLVLGVGQTGSLYSIASESHHLHSEFVRKLESTLKQRVSDGTGVILEINSNADLYYHMLSSYIENFDQYGVVKSFGGGFMNLIEQLGGYECAKAEYNDPMYKDGELYTIKATGNRFFKHNLEGELLEYRREHGIFEEFDLLVYMELSNKNGIYKLLSAKPNSEGYVWIRGTGGCIYENIKYLIHATDAEIEAGKRLEVE